MSRPVTGIDTNILVYALNASAPENAAARRWLAARQNDPDTVLSELVLVELYALLRNPAVSRSRSARPRRPRSSAPSAGIRRGASSTTTRP